MMSKRKAVINSLAFVVPRFGKDLGGGAETLVRQIVLALKNRRDFVDIYAQQNGESPDRLQAVKNLEVWTTCARDHRTWLNELPAGKSEEEGISVWRFPVDERDTDTFIHFELAMREGKVLSTDEQLDWLENSVNSKALYRHIAERGSSFDAIVFAPYLFATSFWGALIYPERSFVIPCLHDEHYAYQSVFKYLFSSVRGLIFNSSAERDLAQELYNFGDDEKPRMAVVGMGFDVHRERGSLKDERTHCRKAVQEKFGNRGLATTYLLYVGRKEEGKNLHLLIKAFSEFRARHPRASLQLAIVGSGDIAFLDSLPEGVIDLGFVSEAEKSLLLQGALALCQPSVNESFSIVVMESWLAGTPVVVHANCSVTRNHVLSSGGGLYFADENEFVAVVEALLNSDELGSVLGISGYDYVCKNYSWEAVMSRLYGALEGFKVIDVTSQSEAKYLNDDSKQSAPITARGKAANRGAF